MFYTYLHCKPDGTPFYIGKGKDDRAFMFRNRNNHHANIINKYGKSNIGVFVFECDSENQAFADEVHQINQLKKEGFDLVNLTNGGEGVSGYKLTAESRVNVSAARMGNKNCIGRIVSAETKQKLSEARKKRVTTDSTRQKQSIILSKRMKDYWADPVMRAKLIIAKTKKGAK